MIKNLNLSLLTLTINNINKKYNYFENFNNMGDTYKDFY